MVVQEYYPRSVVEQGPADDGPVVNGCLSEGAHRDHLLRDDCVVPRKEDTPDLLVVQSCEIVMQDPLCGPAVGDLLFNCFHRAVLLSFKKSSKVLISSPMAINNVWSEGWTGR